VQNRFVVIVGAVSCVATVASCAGGPVNSSQPKGSLPTITAQMTVNGKPAVTTHDVRCSQDGWSHTIEAGSKESGVQMVVGTGDKVTAQSVVLTNVGGFTGTFVANQIGKAQATIIGTTFKVSGTAMGANTDDPNKDTTADFEIKANC
jgi:lipoprotein LpqH